jgi:hypothetical protein
MTIESSRRGFLRGVGALFVAAPAIVRAQSIMPVRDIARLYRVPVSFESFDKCTPAGTTYQWVTKTILGEPTGMIAELQKNGWRAVPSAQYNKMFEVAGDNIEFGGCVLMEKPAVPLEQRPAIIAARKMVSDWEDQVKASGFDGGWRETVSRDYFPTVDWSEKS